MAKKPETLFKEWFRPRLEMLPRSWFFKTQLVALLGIPDFIGCVNGWFVAIELKKSEKDHPSRLQQYILNKILAAGGLAFCASPENAHRILNDIMFQTQAFHSGSSLEMPPPPDSRNPLSRGKAAR